VGAVLASALGGWLADLCGRRTTYFVVSGLTLAINLTIFRLLEPTDAWFLPAVFCSGLVGTVFFGWLPLYLPELFPTSVRATGIGLTYNAGRIATACGILAAGELMRRFEGDYARVGEWASWVYALGMLVILAAPRIDRASAAPRSTGGASTNQPAPPLPRP
jgi:MFS family permease